MIVCCHSGRLGDFFWVAFFCVCFTVQNASALMEGGAFVTGKMKVPRRLMVPRLFKFRGFPCNR